MALNAWGVGVMFPKYSFALEVPWDRSLGGSLRQDRRGYLGLKPPCLESPSSCCSPWEIEVIVSQIRQT
jgi:hypothetical protein